MAAPYTIITIGREFGTGGRQIARAVAGEPVGTLVRE